MREGRRGVREATEQAKLEVVEKRKIQQRRLRKMIRKECPTAVLFPVCLVDLQQQYHLGAF